MGCGSSKNEIHPSPPPTSLPTDTNKNNIHATTDTAIAQSTEKQSPRKQSPRKQSPKKRIKSPKLKSPSSSSLNVPSSMPEVPVLPSVTFEVDMGHRKTQGLIAKHPPKRLQLEPLNMPKLTADMLAEKQQIADSKRKKVLDEKVRTSRRSSRVRHDITASQNMEKEHLFKEIEEQQKIADTMREAKQREIMEKQKLREEHAKKVREKAKRMKADDEALDEIEKDHSYNLGDDETTWDNDDAESGYASPLKGVRKAREHRDVNSASTVDSFDNAFNNRMRFTQGDGVDIQTLGKENFQPVQHGDNFFDS